jgi:hypothetical protein
MGLKRGDQPSGPSGGHTGNEGEGAPQNEIAEGYASQGGRIGIRSSNRDQKKLSLMRFSSTIYGRQEAKRWDATAVLCVVNVERFVEH